MLMDYVLTYLIQKYIAGLDDLDDLDAVREYVTGRIGVVDDELIDDVSMEIWHFEDGLLSEERLRARLAAILQETANYPIWFTNARDSINSVRCSTASTSDYCLSDTWTLHDRPTVTLGKHSFA